MCFLKPASAALGRRGVARVIEPPGNVRVPSGAATSGTNLPTTIFFFLVVVVVVGTALLTIAALMAALGTLPAALPLCLTVLLLLFWGSLVVGGGGRPHGPRGVYHRSPLSGTQRPRPRGNS